MMNSWVIFTLIIFIFPVPSSSTHHHQLLAFFSLPRFLSLLLCLCLSSFTTPSFHYLMPSAPFVFLTLSPSFIWSVFSTPLLLPSHHTLPSLFFVSSIILSLSFEVSIAISSFVPSLPLPFLPLLLWSLPYQHPSLLSISSPSLPFQSPLFLQPLRQLFLIPIPISSLSSIPLSTTAFLSPIPNL